MFDIATIIYNPLWLTLTTLLFVFGLLLILLKKRNSSSDPLFESIYDPIDEIAPTLVFENGKFIRENLEKAGCSEMDLLNKIFESKFLSLQEIKAIVIDHTQDIVIFPKHTAQKQVVIEGQGLYA